MSSLGLNPRYVAYARVHGNDADEQLARGYFRAARALDQSGEATRFLQGRFKQHGARSPAPAKILYHALCDRDAFPEAMAVLD